MTLGEAIRAARKAQQLSLRALARVADVSPTYLLLIERDATVTPPTEAILRRVAGALGLDALHLLALAGRVPDDVIEYLLARPSAVELLGACRQKGIADGWFGTIKKEVERGTDN